MVRRNGKHIDPSYRGDRALSFRVQLHFLWYELTVATQDLHLSSTLHTLTGDHRLRRATYDFMFGFENPNKQTLLPKRQADVWFICRTYNPAKRAKRCKW